MGLGIWDILGLVLFGVAGYMILSRIVVPRFGSPWVSKKRRGEAIERAETLLERDGLDDETRYQLQRCLTTLRSYDAQRESWSGRVPISDIVQQVDDIWNEHKPDGH